MYLVNDMLVFKYVILIFCKLNLDFECLICLLIIFFVRLVLVNGWLISFTISVSLIKLRVVFSCKFWKFGIKLLYLK